MKMDKTDQVINFIKENEFDLMAFQEVMKARDEKADSMYRTKNDLEKSFNKDYPFRVFAPVWGAKTVVKNGNISRDFGGFVEQGSFLLSKYEILEHYNQFYHRDYTEPGYDATYFKRDDHARSVQNVILNSKHTKLQIINIHGIWNEGKLGDERTLHQCQFIIDKALENEYPTIIVGDFNLLPNSESIQLMNQFFRNLVVENKIKTTRPKIDNGSSRENIVCDYVFVNNKVKVNEFNVLDCNISDHMPLLLDFDLEIMK